MLVIFFPIFPSKEFEEKIKINVVKTHRNTFFDFF